jgi:hypothetical protein
MLNVQTKFNQNWVYVFVGGRFKNKGIQMYSHYVTKLHIGCSVTSTTISNGRKQQTRPLVLFLQFYNWAK